MAHISAAGIFQMHHLPPLLQESFTPLIQKYSMKAKVGLVGRLQFASSLPNLKNVCCCLLEVLNTHTRMLGHSRRQKYWCAVLCFCSTAPPTGHPDGVRLHRGVLGPRPRGPRDGPVRRRALLRHGVPGQTVGVLRLGGENPRGNLCRGREVRELGGNDDPQRAAEESQKSEIHANASSRDRRANWKTGAGKTGLIQWRTSLGR